MPDFGDGERGEAEAERVAEIQMLHPALKSWFASDDVPPAHREGWGELPAFWRDAATWEPYREVRRAYMAFLDGVKYVPSETTTPAAAAAADETSPTTVTADDGAVGEQITAPLASSSSAFSAAPNPPPSSLGNSGANGTSAIASSEQPSDQSLFASGSFDELLAARKALWGEKRKTRWAKDAVSLAGSNLNPDGSAMSESQKASAKRAKNFKAHGVLELVERKLGGVVDMTPDQEQELVLNMMKVESLTQRLGSVVQDALAESLSPNRPPSPPPLYDSMGGRTNTREVRLRNQLKFERDTLIKSILRLKPNWQTPHDYVREKPRAKLYIPLKEYPNYNFIGLVIGPRGATQKAMEKETGCKIVIRGRGSVKEGQRVRGDGGADDEDQLHVLITADTEGQVEKAVGLVMPLLQPMDDTVNMHKQEQLQQLAKLNGTEKDDTSLAAHARFNEQMGPDRTFMANVKCALCGEPHATRDCPSKMTSGGAFGGGGMMGGAGAQVLVPGMPPPSAAAPPANMDQEYANFMAELGGGGTAPAATPAASTSTSSSSGGGITLAGGAPVPWKMPAQQTQAQQQHAQLQQQQAYQQQPPPPPPEQVAVSAPPPPPPPPSAAGFPHQGGYLDPSTIPQQQQQPGYYGGYQPPPPQQQSFEPPVSGYFGGGGAPPFGVVVPTAHYPQQGYPPPPQQQQQPGYPPHGYSPLQQQAAAYGYPPQQQQQQQPGYPPPPQGYGGGY